MHPRILDGLTILLAGSALANLVAHLILWLAVRRAGDHVPVWRWFRVMQRYRDLVRARGDSVSGCYVLVLFRCFTLLLGIAVGLVWLSNPAAN